MGRPVSAGGRHFTKITKPHFTSLAEFVRARRNFVATFEPFSCSLLPGPERSDLNARLRRHTSVTHQLYISSTSAQHQTHISSGEIDNDFGERSQNGFDESDIDPHQLDISGRSGSEIEDSESWSW